VIGSVRGTVLDRSPSGEVLIEVGGVGYRALVPLGALSGLEIGSIAFLFTHLNSRDDALTLYGFPTRTERDVFEILLGTVGVGPSLALKILSVHNPAALQRAVTDQDLAALTMVPGVGKRTAERLVIELRSRLDIPISENHDDSEPSSARAEVRAALAGLGYGQDEVRTIISRLPSEGSAEDLLRTALQMLATAR